RISGLGGACNSGAPAERRPSSRRELPRFACMIQLSLTRPVRPGVLNVAEGTEPVEVVVHRAFPCAIVGGTPPFRVIRRPRVREHWDRLVWPHAQPLHRLAPPSHG